MIQVQESIVQLVSKLPLHRQFEVRNFAKFLLSQESDLENANVINLAERGIDESAAADLRMRLQTFIEDWERPEMGVYDA